MDSHLTVLFEKYANKILNNIKIKHYNITTLSIILNACGLINLLYNEFILFILLFFSSYNLNILYDEFNKKYNKETQITAYYNRVGEWLVLFTTFVIFISLYQKKISQNILIIFILICIIYLIHYIIDLTVKNYSNYSNSENINSINDMYDNSSELKRNISKFLVKNDISKNNLEELTKITKYFDKTMIIVYIILLMTYLHYKK